MTIPVQNAVAPAPGSATSSYPLPKPRSVEGLRFGVVALIVGVVTGLTGMGLALLLHMIQHIAYGYSLEQAISEQSFLSGVTAASGERRVIVMFICGLIAGFGWWSVYRFGKKLISIKDAVKSDDPRMPIGSTIAHALLQIITVALGSPLGREVAPREIGALFAGWLSHYAGLSPEQKRIIVACGAGAGLAAVYNVPLGGAMFVLEVLIGTFSWQVAATALATSSIAAGIAWLALGNAFQYCLPDFPLSYSLVAWSVIAGPLLGVAATAFRHISDRMTKASPRNWQLPVIAIVNFTAIGLVATLFPQLLGNGRGPTQLAFVNELTLSLAAILLLLKTTFILTSLRAGAHGGLLTPGITIGALLAILLGTAWTLLWPGVPVGAFAMIGAAAFLAASMRMPMTAIVLLIEFTRFHHDLMIPVLLAVAGSTCATHLTERLAKAK